MVAQTSIPFRLLLLYNIGDKELTAGELRTRGYYLGSNVSYNLKKLVEMGFLDHQRSRVDRRSVRIKLTDKEPRSATSSRRCHQEACSHGPEQGRWHFAADEFSTLNKSLHRLERFWTDQILYRSLILSETQEIRTGAHALSCTRAASQRSRSLVFKKKKKKKKKNVTQPACVPVLAPPVQE